MDGRATVKGSCANAGHGGVPALCRGAFRLHPDRTAGAGRVSGSSRRAPAAQRRPVISRRSTVYGLLFTVDGGR